MEISKTQKFETQLFVAAENLRFSLFPRGSKFQQLMTDAFAQLGEVKQNKLLSQLGITYSRTSRDRHWKSRLDDILSLKTASK